MTGIIALAVPVVAYYVGVDEKELWWGLAYVFLLISAFRVWELEYGKPFLSKLAFPPGNLDSIMQSLGTGMQSRST